MRLLESIESCGFSYEVSEERRETKSTLYSPGEIRGADVAATERRSSSVISGPSFVQCCLVETAGPGVASQVYKAPPRSCSAL
jgi:hypothetical protein